MAAVTSKVSLKLMIDTESRRVLYAEAGKDFVDFLFYILALPAGTFIQLLNQEMVGSLGNIYDSIENLSTSFLRPNVTKDSLLKPRAYFSAGTGLPLHLPNVESSRKLYRCCQCVTHDKNAFCSICGQYSESKYIRPPCANDPYSSTVGDYVKEKVTYMVMDDLAVKPFSTASLTTLLTQLNVKDIGALEEKVVDLGMEEVVKLLKASLLTKSSILTDVFLPILKEEVNCQHEDKMKELLADPSNHLQSSNTTGSIAWAPDDVFVKVMGKERKGRIRGVGFGPSPSGRSSKSALTDIETHSSQTRDNEVAQLKATLATMEDKLAGFDEMKEKLSQFEEMEQRMARMLQQMQHISSQCNQDVPSAQQSPTLQKSSAASYQPSSL